MKCLVCKKEVEDNNYFLLGLDIPYVNLKFHMDCWRQIKGNINSYLTDNAKLVYNYLQESNNTSKKSNKRRKNATK